MCSTLFKMDFSDFFHIIIVCCTVCVVFCHENQQYPPGVPPPKQQDGHHHVPPPQAGGTGNQAENLQYQTGDAPVPHANEERNRFRESSQDQDHIMEHMNGILNKPRDQMTAEELQFYYFKLHDYDNNNKLDGTELIKAITHFHQDENKNVAEQAKVFSDTEIDDIVQAVMKQDDFDNDGYIEYAEFVAAQKRPPPEAEAATPTAPPPPQ